MNKGGASLWIASHPLHESRGRIPFFSLPSLSKWAWNDRKLNVAAADDGR